MLMKMREDFSCHYNQTAHFLVHTDESNKSCLIFIEEEFIENQEYFKRLVFNIPTNKS